METSAGAPPLKQNEWLLPAAAVLTWATVSGFALYVLWQRNQASLALTVVLPLILANLVAMWWAMDDHPQHRRRRLWSLGVQLVSALAIGWLVPLSFLPIYTVVWISTAAAALGFRAGVWLLGVVLIAWYVIMTFSWRDSGVLLTVLLYGTFHIFALFSMRNTQIAEQARSDVEALNRELLATQHLLSEASRQGERTRIARNLHDLLGHHLTALTIQLQIAERLTEGEAQASVSEARALARLLLSDVREAVSTLRQEDHLDLATSLKLLIENVPALDIDLDVAPGLDIRDIEVAEALLRCVQESLTNTLRHAAATRSSVKIWQEDDGFHLTVSDNGTAPAVISEGNGLRGLRERIEQRNGRLNLTRHEGALMMQVWLPEASL